MSDSIPHGFRQIPGFPRYAIDENGKVLSIHKPGPGDKNNRPWSESRLLKPMLDKDGYHIARLSHDGKKQNIPVHKLVLTTFSTPCPSGMECRHLDGNRTNNHISNLAWSTHSENLRDKFRHGTQPQGERCYQAKLKDADILEIRARAANGETQHAIAKEFAVPQAHVSRIVHRKNWKHV